MVLAGSTLTSLLIISLFLLTYSYITFYILFLVFYLEYATKIKMVVSPFILLLPFFPSLVFKRLCNLSLEIPKERIEQFLGIWD